jgi:hypothetical protein
VLVDNAVALGVVKATLADIKAGSFVGIGAMPQSDGTQRALEVLIFPESMRGTAQSLNGFFKMPFAGSTPLSRDRPLPTM